MKLKTEIENRLQKLTGSEKQIAWAEKIRAQMILDAGKWSKFIDDARFTARSLLRKQGIKFDDEAYENGDSDKLIEILKPEATEKLLSQTSAKWFIDNRETRSFISLLNMTETIAKFYTGARFDELLGLNVEEIKLAIAEECNCKTSDISKVKVGQCPCKEYSNEDNFFGYELNGSACFCELTETNKFKNGSCKTVQKSRYIG